MQAQAEVEETKQRLHREAASNVQEWDARREQSYRQQAMRMVQDGLQGVTSTVRRAVSASATRIRPVGGAMPQREDS
eukprot:9459087-Pyramimonas_sp.AAC.1